MTWTAYDVERILDRSPWTFGVLVGTPKGATGRLVYYRIRLLSAKPVREALLRRLTLVPDSQIAISIEEALWEGRLGHEQARLARFTQTFPEDIRITGDPDHIVISVTLVVSALRMINRTEDGQYLIQARTENHQWQEDPWPATITAERPENLSRSAFLSTDQQKRTGIVRYDVPGADGLGAKFYFPRMLPGGTPLVATGDNKLLFELTIAGRKIQGKFDLRKMMREGKVEI